MPLHQTPSSQHRRLSWLAPLWGCVLGAAWQVTQARLWHLSLYQILLAWGLLTLLFAYRWRGRPWLSWWLMLLGAACCVAGGTGWRAHAYLAQTLPQALEAVDLQVEGRIDSMLQNQANGQRLLAIELMTRTAQDTVGTMALPFGLALAKGIGLKIDDKKQEGTLEFSTCQAAGCMVPVAFDAKALEALKTGTTLKILGTASDTGQPVEFSISLNGFSNALARTAQLSSD